MKRPKRLSDILINPHNVRDQHYYRGPTMDPDGRCRRIRPSGFYSPECCHSFFQSHQKLVDGIQHLARMPILYALLRRVSLTPLAYPTKRPE